MFYLLFGSWIALWLINLIIPIKGKKCLILFSLTIVFIGILICGHEYIGDGDSTDFLHYQRDYESNFIYVDSTNLYYLFYGSQKLAINFGLDYFMWWKIMTVITCSVLLFTIYKFNLNGNYFLFSYMFIIITMYAGFKYYYGFVFFFVALCCLFYAKKHNLFWFYFFVIVASGLHIMYYIFLLLPIIKFKVFKEKIFIIVFLILFILIFLGKFIGGGSYIMQLISNFVVDIFQSQESDRGVYFETQTNYGFIILVAIHFMIFVFSYYYRKKCISYDVCDNSVNLLYRLCIFYFIFYPFFFFSLTFIRLLTTLSIFVITVSANKFSYFKSSDRIKISLIAFVIFVFFALYFFGQNNCWNYNLIPLFS